MTSWGYYQQNSEYKKFYWTKKKRKTDGQKQRKKEGRKEGRKGGRKRENL